MSEPVKPAETGDDKSTVEFFGEKFTTNSDVNPFAVMEFAEAASDGVDAETFRGLGSLLRLATEIIAEPDRERFRAVARHNRASSVDLMRLLGFPVEVEADRPTGRSSDSSDGPSSIEPKSGSSAADRAALRLASRPDLREAIAASRAS